jgi:Holliday junction resolvase RusA-like endonuclease
MKLDVYGTPAPQGSKRAFAVRGKGGVPTGKIAVIESSHDRVKSWRQSVIDAALSDDDAIATPIAVKMLFFLARPKGHYRTGKNADQLRPGAPRRPEKMPDLSKLVRATEDALTDAGLWRDDALVVEISAMKYWADSRPPGAVIVIQETR